MLLCPICYEEHKQLYKIANCRHEFCRSCCVQHITQKSSRFTKILCPHPDCGKQFNKDPFLMAQLSKQVLDKVKKYEQYEYMQQNSHIRPCDKIDCQGHVDMRQNRKQCNTCGSPHCPKCMKLFHQKACVIDKHDQQMRQANYQKCPNCFIWVQKMAGCNYINCKCGTAFCYVCGARFSDDPCRKNKSWQQEREIRNLLSKIQFNLPQQKFLYLLLPLTIFAKIILIILWTVVSSVIFWLTLILGFAFLILLTPVLVIAIFIGAKKKVYKILIFILSPLMIVFFILVFIVLALGYPILRNFYHHGVYDGVDNFMGWGVITYLKVVIKIFAWST